LPESPVFNPNVVILPYVATFSELPTFLSLVRCSLRFHTYGNYKLLHIISPGSESPFTSAVLTTPICTTSLNPKQIYFTRCIYFSHYSHCDVKPASLHKIQIISSFTNRAKAQKVSLRPHIAEVLIDILVQSK